MQNLRPKNLGAHVASEDWDARDLMLGQLLYVHDFQRENFQANARPAIFAGYRLDVGSAYKGVYLVWDYNELKELSPGYQTAMSAPCEEALFLKGHQSCHYMLHHKRD